MLCFYAFTVILNYLKLCFCIIHRAQYVQSFKMCMYICVDSRNIRFHLCTYCLLVRCAVNTECQLDGMVFIIVSIPVLLINTFNLMC